MTNNPWKLSAREIEVIQAACTSDGTATSKVVGEMLGISAKTVDAHWDNLMSKLGAQTRTQAVLTWDRANREPKEPGVKAPPGYVHCMHCEGRGFLKGDR